MRIPLVFLVFVIRVAWAYGDAPTPRAPEPVLARIDRLSPLKVTYRLTYNLLKAPATRPTSVNGRGPRLTPYRDGRTSDDVFEYSADTVKWSSDLSAEDVEYLTKTGVKPVPHMESLYHKGTAEVLNEVGGRGPVGSIQGPDLKMPAGSVVDIGLGLRVGERQTDGWLSAESLVGMTRSTDEEGRVVLSQVNSVGQTIERVYDPHLGYAMVVYRRLYGEKRIAVCDIIASDFRSVDGVPLPFRLVMTRRSATGVDSTRYTAIVNSYTLGTEPDSHLKFPKNTQVVDARTDVYYQVKRDNQTLTNEVLANTANGGESDAVRVVRARAVLIPQPQRRFPVVLAVVTGLVLLAGIVAIFSRRRARSLF